MTSMGKVSFHGFQIGAVAAALLLSYGIESAVAGVSDPVTAGIASVVNWIIVRGHFQVLTLNAVTGPWLLTLYSAVGSIAGVLLGLWLGAWVKRQSDLPS